MRLQADEPDFVSVNRPPAPGKVDSRRQRNAHEPGSALLHSAQVAIEASHLLGNRWSERGPHSSLRL